MQASEVRDTIINGKVLMRNGELTGLDENELIVKAQEWVNQNYS
jgi:hypothetical protein